MKKIFTLLLTTCLTCSLQAQQNYWQQEVNYIIDVSLDDRQHSLDGFLKLQYTNNSPDTLSFIWFHLWPNAFKNDRTAFSDQLLLQGRTDFYFSNREDKGYINRLDFRVNNASLRTEDHPHYIDIIKVYLPTPLAPGAQTVVTTPFHVQLPKNFSRGGHVGKSYQATQWYPKPAVYDKRGWHPMPYLDQGEFYSEFGSYDVRITVPQDYLVAATGQLQSEEEKQWMKGRGKTEEGSKKEEVGGKMKRDLWGKPIKPKTPAAGNKKPATGNQPPVAATPVTNNQSLATKTLQYKQDHIHDFAWFADKQFVVDYDTIQLASGRTIEAWTFYAPADSVWKKSLSFLKDAVHFRSRVIGEYPYNVVSVVETHTGFDGGMEYPTITNIGLVSSPKTLDKIIEHEVGHNWFYGILASNERDHPWMDEGLNSYYGDRYVLEKYGPRKPSPLFANKEPENEGELMIDAYAKERKDQPITTASADFTEENYGIIAYYKTALWAKRVEEYLGQGAFDSAMKAYYSAWQFKHPAPEDFKQVLQQNTSKDLSSWFRLLDTTGSLPGYTGSKKLKPAFLFALKDYKHVNYINWLPMVGYNNYDKIMLGLLLHNFTMPSHSFQFYAAPLYAFGSKQLSGMGGVAYTWHPTGTFRSIELGLGGAAFSSLEASDSTHTKIFGGFRKIVPSLRFTFRNRSMLSTTEKWIEWKTYLISEKGFNYITASDDQTYASEGNWKDRYLNQLTFNITDYRKLYPYDAQLQVQQGSGFYRVNATGHYYFNYARGGGMQVRAFAAKFGYLGGKSNTKFGDTYYYQPKLTAVRGEEDYTYSNYFVGRSEFDGVASQQVMMRDGGLKLRTDLFSGLQGRSDNWVAALNFYTTLPEKIFPIKLPLRLFADVGTYADAWKENAGTSRFLYVAGVQVSLFKDLLNVYAPIFYSKEFRDALKSVPEENTFGKKISFSLDIHRFNLRKLIGY